MGRFWRDPQNIIAVGVTLISVCALVVSITQTRIMVRQSNLMDMQARASVRPIVTLGTERSFDPQTRQLDAYRLMVTNSGVGPASVEAVTFEYDGEFFDCWGALFDTFNVPDSIPTYIDQITFNRSIIQAGQSIPILDLSENLSLARAIYQRLGTAEVRFIYSSIYGDRFEGGTNADGRTNEAIDDDTQLAGQVIFKD